MKKYSLVLAALLVGSGLCMADEGIVISTDSTVSGTVDVKNKGELNVGGVTITGGNTKIRKGVEISSTTKLKDATVDNSKVGIGNIDITNSPIEKGKIITDSTIDNINAKDSTANIGGITVENSTMKNGELNSKTVSTGNITLDKGKLEMGNISVRDNSVINGGEIISDVKNSKTIKAKNGGSVSMGNAELVDSTMNGGTISSKVDNSGTIGAYNKGEVNMGNISVKDKSMISGDSTEVKSTVLNVGGTVTADGQNSKVNMGNIDLSKAEVSGGAKVDSMVVNTSTVEAKTNGTISMGKIGIENGSVVSGQGTEVKSLVINSGAVSAEKGGAIDMGSISVKDSKVKDGAKVDSMVVNTSTVEAKTNGTISMGKIGIENGSVVSGQGTEVKSLVINSGAVSAEKGGAIDMGSISVKDSKVKDGAKVSSTVKNAKEVTASGEGSTISMGKVDLLNGAEVSGQGTEVKSTVTNNGVIQATGTGGSSVDLGSIAIVGGKVNNGSKITSTVTNAGAIKAIDGGAITMGRIESNGATVSGATLNSKVTVTGSGSVTAAGQGAKANFGGIRVGNK